MANILHIDTAGKEAIVMTSKDGNILSIAINNLQNEHAAFVHPAVESVLKKTGWAIQDLDAVAVANGPGSYTGLRVGLAAAKGICYVLKKPLICVNSLHVLAAASIFQENVPAYLYVPMIDARRMEVFTAVYNHQGIAVISPHAKILDETSFQDELDSQKVIFSGDAIEKWKKICSHPNALFSPAINLQNAFATLSYEAFMKKDFADLAYAEPFYIKNFHFGN